VFNDNYMYFGGIPDETAILDRPGQLSTVDFVGCIKSISINGNEKNLIKESLNRTGNIKLLINSYFNLASQ
jgi:hypothetical protein